MYTFNYLRGCNRTYPKIFLIFKTNFESNSIMFIVFIVVTHNILYNLINIE